MHTIILIHGVRTEGPWYDIARPILEQCTDTVVIPLSYGYFDVFRFLIPGFTRRGPQKRISEEINTFLSKKYDGNKGKLSVVAHSFGTYTIKSILETNPKINLDYLILCNSIIDKSYDFSLINNQIKKRIINEVGFRDIWPVLAKISTIGFGDSGTYGFGSASCTDRYHDIDHGGFFNFPMIHQYWLSVFSKDIVVESEFNRNSRSRPRLVHYLALLPTGSLAFLILTILWYTLLF